MVMNSKAFKITIVTEKLIQDGVAKIIEAAGAGGYTVIDGGGKGSREMRTRGRSVVVAFANVKIELVTNDRDSAVEIADKVAEMYFDNFPGIIYIEEVEVLRSHDF